MKARFVYGATIVAAFAGLLLIDRALGHPVCFALVAFAAIVLSLLEYGELVKRSSRFDFGPVAFYSAVLVALKVPGLVPRTAVFAAGPEVLVLAILVLHVVCRAIAAGDVDGALRRLGADVFGFVWIVLGLSCFLDVLGRFGVGVTLTAIFVAKSHDIGGLLVGKLLGRRKLVPKVSPNKTVEGAIGGVLLSLVTAGVAAAILGAPAIAGLRFIPLGIAVSLAALVGDLAESLLKRDAGVKDSASWIPGFGGVLDMTDSLTVAGPVALAALAALSRIE